MATQLGKEVLNPSGRKEDHFPGAPQLPRPPCIPDFSAWSLHPCVNYPQMDLLTGGAGVCLLGLQKCAMHPPEPGVF